MKKNNLREAYAILAGIPQDRFVHDLNVFFNQPKWFGEHRQINCGTHACGAGWLSLHPSFIRVNGCDFFSWSQKHFGPNSFDQLFAPRGYSPHDLHSRCADLTDKELLLFRFRCALGQTPFQSFTAAKKDASLRQRPAR